MPTSVNTPDPATPTARRRKALSKSAEVTSTPPKGKKTPKKKAAEEKGEEIEESIVLATPASTQLQREAAQDHMKRKDVSKEKEAEAEDTPTATRRKEETKEHMEQEQMAMEIDEVGDGDKEGTSKKESRKKEKKEKRKEQDTANASNLSETAKANPDAEAAATGSTSKPQDKSFTKKKAKKLQAEESDDQQQSGELVPATFSKRHRKKEKRKDKKMSERELIPFARVNYKVSHSIGGKFLPIEPIFTRNEQFIMVALPHSLRVYSTKTSLLHRTFDIPDCSDDLVPESEKRIVSYGIDPLDNNNVFIATYSGRIYLWNWAEGELVEKWNTEHHILLMEICHNEEERLATEDDEESEIVAPKQRNVYIVATPTDKLIQKRKSGKAEKKRLQEEKALQKKERSMNAVAGELIRKELKRQGWDFYRAILDIVTKGEGGSEQTSRKAAVRLRLIHKLSRTVTAFKVLDKGRVIVAISRNMVWVGNKAEETHEQRSGKKAPWGAWRYFTFDHELSCLDVKKFEEQKKPKNAHEKERKGIWGYVAVGDIKGAIYLWHNILNPESTGDQPGDVRRLHWHRTCVGSVKLSQDGNYLISGGDETVLVIWQIDTGHKQFLPHLTSAIEHIVVSPSGSSYAVRLSDNSLMVLSTTELKPKTHIAGIQAFSLPTYYINQPDTSVIKTVDSLQSSLEPTADTNTFKLPRVPCAVHPTRANHLLLATSSHSTSSLLLTPTSAAADPRPYLQTYDTFAERPLSKQALARTIATDIKLGPQGNTLLEPTVRLISISQSGDWLATLDEWYPPTIDSYNQALLGQSAGGEVYLKFWRREERTSSWELVTRVDSPHPSPTTITFNGGAKVLDIVALPGTKTPGFATLGADGSVRIWKAKVRTRGGVVVKHSDLLKGGVKAGEDVVQVNWGCRKVIQFTKGTCIAPSSAGSIAISSDGSVIAVSLSETSSPFVSPSQSHSVVSPTRNSVVYILDPATGLTFHSLRGFQGGAVAGVKIVDRYLIIVSTRKVVSFDLVRGRVRWELSLPQLVFGGKKYDQFDLENAAIDPEDIFIAAGTTSYSLSPSATSTDETVPPSAGINKPPTFALAINSRHKNPHTSIYTPNPPPSYSSHIFVFNPSGPAVPLFSTKIPSVGITALQTVPYIPIAGDAEVESVVAARLGGYVYLDMHARGKYIVPGAVQVPDYTLPALSATSEAELQGGLSSLYTSVAPVPTTTTAPEEGEDEVELSIERNIYTDQLANILFSQPFDAGGATNLRQQTYDMLNLAEVFDRVVELYARPPLRKEDVEMGEEEKGERMEID
ncbi:hypothetical protein BDZ91DRAFT_845564 [Kalaharituber pfeilii]|nr:hypothetical protein BDZ91DRAFT_845564 [Kalaharituber pfeilii]